MNLKNEIRAFKIQAKAKKMSEDAKALKEKKREEEDYKRNVRERAEKEFQDHVEKLKTAISNKPYQKEVQIQCTYSDFNYATRLKELFVESGFDYNDIYVNSETGDYYGDWKTFYYLKFKV